jgi:hypothetical protein
VAKIYKMTLFVVDPNDDYSEFETDSLVSDIELGLTGNIIVGAFDIKDKVFEWNNNLEINKIDCARDAYEKYF